MYVLTSGGDDCALAVHCLTDLSVRRPRVIARANHSQAHAAQITGDRPLSPDNSLQRCCSDFMRIYTYGLLFDFWPPVAVSVGGVAQW